MEKKGQSGMVKGIFIPIDTNNFTEKDGAVYMEVRVVAKDEEDQYGQHGFISQSVNSKIYKAASDEQKEEFKKLPILGNIKDFSNKSSAADTSGAATTTFVSEDSDLPF